ncbi:MAG: hypothetical protein JSS79_15600 [Bacteroidetes bacterium]|nr:hypothetical protein [Bacteroidota bacterium]
MNKRITIVLLLAFYGAKLVNAQSSSSLMGSRAAGLGYTSSTLSDEWSLFNNVGGLGKAKQTSATFAYEIKPALNGANRMAASAVTHVKAGTFGVGVFKFGDDIYSEQIASFGFGNQIGNTSLGSKINYIQYRAEGFGTSKAISVDFGGISTITPQIQIGAYITNLTQSKLKGASGERLPTKMVAGLGFKPSESVFVATEIEKDLAYAVTWRGGMEYAVYKKIFFRTGFNLNPSAFYFGLGAHKKNLKLDYALRFSQLLGVAHQASLVYSLASKK